MPRDVPHLPVERHVHVRLRLCVLAARPLGNGTDAAEPVVEPAAELRLELLSTPEEVADEPDEVVPVAEATQDPLKLYVRRSVTAGC